VHVRAIGHEQIPEDQGLDHGEAFGGPVGEQTTRLLLGQLVGQHPRGVSQIEERRAVSLLEEATVRAHSQVIGVIAAERGQRHKQQGSEECKVGFHGRS